MKNTIFTFIIVIFNFVNIFSQTLPKLPNVEKEKIPKLEYQIKLLYQDFKTLKKLSSEEINYYKSKDILIVNDKVKVEVHVRNPIDITKINFDLYEIEKDDYYGVFQNIVQMLLPIKNIKKLSEEPYVLYICVPKIPIPDVISEGVAKINADEFHIAGYTGNGIKVAIIDGGFTGYEDLLGIELPNYVITKSFYNSTSGNGDITGEGDEHGTAVAEIVHDVAPNAQLYLINFNTGVELSYAVDYAISQGVKIINHSMSYFYQPYDGTGPICDIAINAINNGILWVNSAGNHRNKHYESYFNNTEIYGWHRFYDNVEVLKVKNVNIGENIEAHLSWDDWPYSSNDYDFYLWFEDGDYLVIVDSSETSQTGNEPPVEMIDYNAERDGTYYLAVWNKSADGNSKIEIFSSENDLEFINEEVSYKSSILDPATAEEVLSVGATTYIYDVIEDYSSMGPTNDGRIKPDVVAPAGVSNYTENPFYGTSASAPHVAGAAALLLEKDPSRTNTDLKDLLESQTVDLGEIGKDNIYGYGILNLEMTYPNANAKATLDLYTEFPTNTSNSGNNVLTGIGPDTDIYVKVYLQNVYNIVLYMFDLLIDPKELSWVKLEFVDVYEYNPYTFEMNILNKENIFADIDLFSNTIPGTDDGNFKRISIAGIFSDTSNVSDADTPEGEGLAGIIKLKTTSSFTTSDKAAIVVKNVFLGDNSHPIIEEYASSNYYTVGWINAPISQESQNIPVEKRIATNTDIVEVDFIDDTKVTILFLSGGSNAGKTITITDMGSSLPDTLAADSNYAKTEGSVAAYYYIETDITESFVAELEIKYTDENLSAAGLSSEHADMLVLAYFKTDELIWCKVPTIIDRVNMTAKAIVDNFSIWALVDSTNPNVIPVELLSFILRTDVKNGVVLEWTTSSETNNLGFEIEKSYVGYEFIKIGFVKGNGTTMKQCNYQFTDDIEKTRKIYYRLKQIDFDGSYEYSEIISVTVNNPDNYSLFQNFPNPFNSETKIKYQLPKESFITIQIYNLLGEKTKTLVNERKHAGYHSVKWDGTNDSNIKVASGIYIYMISTEDFIKSKKLIFLK